MEVNFGNVAHHYAKYRNDLPDELFASFKVRDITFQDKKVADLGSGTGILSRALFKEGATVTGIEPSKELIQKAEEIDISEEMTIKYVNTGAENASLDFNAYDYVTVLRAWHWFDRVKTLEVINQILKRNGKLIVMDSGFISQVSLIIDTLDMIKAYMPDGKLKAAGSKASSTQRINGFPVEWFKEWEDYGLDLNDTYKFNYMVSFSNEEWTGRVGSLSWLSQIQEADRRKLLEQLYNHLNKKFTDTQHDIEHACTVAILTKR